MVSTALGVLAVVGMLATVLSVWSHEVLFDTATVSRAVDDAMQDPEVTEALALFLGDQIADALPVEELLDDRVPSSLDRFRPVLVDGARRMLHDGLLRVLRDDRARAAVVTAAETSHRKLLRMLDGGSLVDGAVVDGDSVTVNLLPIVSRGLVAVQSTGLLRDVTIPELARGGDPAVQREQLSEALGREPPDDFGELVVFRSDSVARAGAVLARAQHAVVIFRRSVLVVFAVTAATAVGAIALARRRRRATVVLVGGIVLAVAAGHLAIQAVLDQMPSLAVNPGARRAIRIVVETLARGLLTALTAILVAGFALLAATYLTGQNGPLRGLRRSGAPLGTIRRSLRRRADLVTGAVVVALATAVVVIGPQPLLFGAATAVAIVILAVTWSGDQPDDEAAGPSTDLSTDVDS